MVKVFTALDIWQKARILVKSVYLLSQKLPESEQYVLRSQLRRAAVSVPSNIAEGCGKRTIKDLSRHLDIAIGSLCELETQVYLSLDLDYISTNDQTKLVAEIILLRKMIISFQKKLHPF